MEKKNSAKKKTVGRPAKLPPGERRNVRCVLVNGEMTALRQATGTLKMSQLELARAAILHAVKAVNHGQPPPFLPGAEGLPHYGEAGAGMPQFETMDPKEWTRIRDIYPPDAFTLRVRGNSMTNAAILDGDWAVVRPASTAERGQLVIATVDDGLTIKKLDIVTRGDNKGVWLNSVCPDERPPIQISGVSDRRVIGVCVGVIGKR